MTCTFMTSIGDTWSALCNAILGRSKEQLCGSEKGRHMLWVCLQGCLQQPLGLGVVAQGQQDEARLDQTKQALWFQLNGSPICL